ncbi:putative classical arabinogalactan protein 9 [Cocos nucifera]|uniref:Putative classical arabinogalactan protein 9 n=1 Tax=Cocos nucifera TaxID=13894 RepID=A0A8K0N2D3_COCNU|nr:putative classical arabinogalactan protein 9 [Cocos nucifera]
MSNSRDIGQETAGTDVAEILSLTAAKQENLVDAVQGISKFAKEFMDLIDAADATGQADIAREALKRLAAAGSVKGALQVKVLRGVALRLANHGELTRLSALVTNLITAGHGREAAFAAAVLGDNALMEKAWQDTGMLAEAVLHAHAHGRPTLKNLVQAWNKMLQKELEHTPSVKTDAAAAFLASLEDTKLTSLGEAGKKPPIEILPPGMASLSAPPITIKKPPTSATQTPIPTAQSNYPATQGSSQAEPDKPLMLEAPPPAEKIDGNPPVTEPLSSPGASAEGAQVPPVTEAPPIAEAPPITQAPPPTVTAAESLF